MAVHNFALRLSERGDRGNAEAIQGVLKVLEGKGREIKGRRDDDTDEELEHERVRKLPDKAARVKVGGQA